MRTLRFVQTKTVTLSESLNIFFHQNQQWKCWNNCLIHHNDMQIYIVQTKGPGIIGQSCSVQISHRLQLGKLQILILQISNKNANKLSILYTE